MASKKTKRQFPRTLCVDWADGTADESDYLNSYENLPDMTESLNEEDLAQEVVAVYELKYVATVERKVVLTPKK